MIRLVYLDLDDTLNTLSPYLLNRMGCEIGVREYSKYPVKGFGYDIVSVCNFFLAQDTTMPDISYTVDEFWGEIDEHLWSNVPRSNEFEQIIELSAGLVGRENVRILTRATANADCLSGKFNWMQKNLPSWLRKKFLVVGEDCKHLLADKNSFLLDDHDENVTAFRNAGGVAALMPRPWNLARKVVSIRGYLNDIYAMLQSYDNQ